MLKKLNFSFKAILLIFSMLFTVGCQNKAVPVTSPAVKSKVQLFSTQIEKIDAYVRSTNENIHLYPKCEADIFDLSSEGASLVVYYNNKDVIKTEVEYFGEMGKERQDIYLMESEFVFVESSEVSYDKPFYFDNYKIVSETINQFYFKDGSPVIWRKDGTEVEFSSEEFALRRERLESSIGQLNPKISECASGPIDSEWKTYKNDEYGFQIDYPNALNGYPIKVTQQGNHFAFEGLRGLNFKYEMPFIIGLNIESEEDLLEFIREKYGDTCEIDEVKYDSPTKDDLYPVTVRVNSFEEGCWINWITLLRYSPKKKKVFAMDLGQEPPIMETVENTTGEYELIDYSYEVANSFRFIDQKE